MGPRGKSDTKYSLTGWNDAMMNASYLDELHVAVEAARRAGTYLRDSRHDVEIAKIKSGDKDFATHQDAQSERMVLQEIAARFASDAVLAEESRPTDHSAERLWIVDPLDGTRNYAHGLTHFAVSIAFCYAGEVKAAAVYIPCEDEMFHACRDHGAFLNGDPLSQHSSESKSLEASLVATGFSYYQGRDLHPHIEVFERVMNVATDVLRFGSAAADTCYVAAGHFGAYYESGLKPWDVAAATLIVQEAGGIVSDVSGAPLDLFAKDRTTFSLNVLAARNAGIHRRMVELVGRPQATRPFYPSSPLDNT